MEIKKLIAAILICNLAGIVGSVFTASSVGTWYQTINKPGFTPPGWVFAPAWTTLYILMGVSMYLIWIRGLQTPGVKTSLVIFSSQLLLNTIWSILFFGLRNPFYAFVEIIFLWILIVASIVSFYRIDRRAAILLIPYILWVSFAAYLNYSVWQLNI
ncbi:MAG: tryptophan-rich sensory protein [Candidatus Altiarchaeota archaeon]|nr:tryptophan-rich sensory protein [Candidatus Altiarchaeota archaeon]